jgi:hypothetical protein
MKYEVFIQYVSRVINLFGITKEEFFSKNKKRDIVDARQLVYYLCSKRPMQITYIVKYMNDSGYSIKHSSIIHGIAAVEKKIAKDNDYVSIVKEVEGAVFIIDKYNPNAPETEEQDGLQSAKLRLSKVLQRYKGQQDLTNNSYPLLKNMQLKTNNSNSDQLNQGMSTREKGKKLLEELRAMGPDLSLVGKVSVRPLSRQSKETQTSKEQPLKNTQESNQRNLQQETDSSISPSRQLRKLRIDIIKERSELRDLISKEQENSTKQGSKG